MATKEMCDACHEHSLQRIKKMAGVEVGDGWPAFSVLFWIKDLNLGYYFEFEEEGKLAKHETITGQPVAATAIVTMTSDDYVGQITQEISLQEKYFSGELTIKGDVSALQRFAVFRGFEPYYPPGHPKYEEAK